jgi:hypothetical protein
MLTGTRRNQDIDFSKPRSLPAPATVYRTGIQDFRDRLQGGTAFNDKLDWLVGGFTSTKG